MKKKLLLSFSFLMLIGGAIFFVSNLEENQNNVLNVKKKKKTREEKMEAVRERLLHEFNLQKDPETGTIPQSEKTKEFEKALLAQEEAKLSRTTNSNTYISRGPSNLGGRTRALKYDISDNSGNTIIAGGVSSGVFRTTNGGSSWVRVSPFDEIHNATTIAQDPRPESQNVWYYGTGEWSGNSASLGSPYRGHGIWKSTDSGVTWQQIPETAVGDFDSFDNPLDYVNDLQVHPTTGELFIAAAGKIMRFNGTTLTTELEVPGNGTGWTDIEITSTGIVYAAIQGGLTNGGVWRSPTGNGSWTRISENGNPTGWNASGRITLAIAPSNENIVYALYNNGLNNNPPSSPNKEADFWRYDSSLSSWTNYSTKVPDEPGSNSSGNDPFSIQGGYDLVVSVKPDNENFVLIGGTNAYKISNITTDVMFSRIGGYRNNFNYSTYNTGGVNHHPDIHAFDWHPSNSNIVVSGTDGGVHRTDDINSVGVAWTNLNNNYQTYQYYHVSMVNETGEDFVIGGAQDNGTTLGGITAGNPNSTDMDFFFGGDGAAVAVTKNSGGAGYITYLSNQNGRMLRGSATAVTADITPFNSNTGNDYSSQFVTYFYMDPDNPNTIYYASDTRILRTNNAPTVGSNSWTDLGLIGGSGDVTTIETTRGAYNPSTSLMLYGGTISRVYKVTDPQNISNLIGNISEITPSGVPFQQYTSDIAVHPTNSDIAIVTYSNYGANTKNIYITSNLTSPSPTWTLVERNLNSHSIRSAAIAEVDGQTIYFVGTARGLYSSGDPSNSDWVLEGPNTVGLSVVSGLVYRHSDNKLLVGTHGNGMFETTVSTLSTETLEPNEVKIAMYPNPTQFELKFVSDDFTLNNDTKFLISDINGRTIKAGKLNDKSINVSSLSKGVYLVRLTSNGVSTAKKFVKN